MILSAQMAWAAPQGKGIKPYSKFEARQQQMQEFRANRRAERLAAHQAAIAMEPEKKPPSANSAPPSISHTVQQNQGNIERDLNQNKLNRLTPEERQALRRQIREARREIYLQRTQ